MAPNEKNIEIIFGNSRKRPTNTRHAQTPAARRLAEIEEQDQRWRQQRAEEIAALPPLPPNPSPPPLNEGFPHEDADPEDLDPEFLPRDQTPNPFDTNINLSNFETYLAHPTTQTKRIRLEQRWKAIQKEVFPIFLKCRDLTSSWADLSCWNLDRRPPCSCTKQVTRPVDCVDLLSMSLLLKITMKW